LAQATPGEFIATAGLRMPGIGRAAGRRSAATVHGQANPTPTAKPSTQWDGSHTAHVGDEKKMNTKIGIHLTNATPRRPN
jgi:hypothetical protein